MILNFYNFINENKNEKEGYINFQSTNLKDDFNYLNKKLFGNELNIVPLRWMKSKNKLGVINSTVEYRIIGRRKKKVREDVKGIAISNFYKLTRQQYLDVLAHEMIHLWIAQKNIVDDKAHGRRFKAMMYDINRKFSEFNIKESENASYYSVNTPNDKIKEMGVILIEHDNNNSIIVTSEKAIENKVELESFLKKLEEKINNRVFLAKYKNVSITAYKVRIKAITTYKYMRNFKSKSFNVYDLDSTPQLVEQIKASPKLLSKRIR